MGRVPPPPKKRDFQLPVNQVVCGSNIEVVSKWPTECVDGIVTDPPYGLGFMGKEWDTFDQNYLQQHRKADKKRKPRKDGRKVAAWGNGADAGTYDYSRNSEFQQWFTIWAKAMLRICKPGAMMFCFGGTRTYHRLTCAIEDAGWEIRDCMMWLYGSGFPKSHDISKAIDKKAGVKRTKGERLWSGGKRSGGISHGGEQSGTVERKIYDAPATELAQLWNGYGTALKPAWEPIIIAMKPIDGTFANNAEKHRVAGLNIDGGRINYISDYDAKHQSDICKGQKNAENGKFFGGKGKSLASTEQPQGRWPANLILDEEAGKMLDEQSGTLKSGKMKAGQKRKKSKGAGGYHNNFPDEATAVETFGDSGGASRFFYCAKVSKKERNLGMEDQKNNHPTVKPLTLIKYLCTLLKMPNQNQIILDPFMGSGTIGMACKELGINFIGIEKEQDYCEIARKRIAAI